MASDVNLLPCPFCGGEAQACVGHHAKYDAKVACRSCSAEGALFGTDDYKGGNGSAWLDAAIAAWNTRANLAQPQGASHE